MEISFKDKTVLVTGAGQGIGRDIVKQLVNCGANVIALSRTKVHLDTLKQEEPSIQIVSVDLSNWEETRKVVESLGIIHCLVNNAAIAILGPFLTISKKSLDTLFDVNVKAVVNVSQVVVKKMIENKISGSIVNLSSQAGIAGLPNHAAYCGTKGALEMISKVMAIELGPHQIRVNCVNPTVVMTDMGRLGWSDPRKAEWMLSRIPLGRFAEVEEVVNAVCFLLSDKASMTTGAFLPVEGGFLSG